MKYDHTLKPDRRLIYLTLPPADVNGQYFTHLNESRWVVWEKRNDGTEWGQFFQIEAAAKQKLEEFHQIPDEYSGGGYVEEPEN